MNWKKFKQKLHYFFHYKIPFTKGWNEWNNPYYYWWKVRKYFKRPKAHFVCGEYYGYFGLPCRPIAYKFPKIHITGLGWKSKYNSPRHEWDPVIALIWTSPFKTTVENNFAKNGKFTYHKIYWIGWIFNWINKKDTHSRTRSMATWEAILDMFVYGKTLEEVKSLHVWGSMDDQNITIDYNLNENNSDK